MYIDHDVLLILIGAGIGFVSSLGTSLFQFWLNKRAEKYKREMEREQTLTRIQIADIQDVKRYTRDWDRWERCAPPQMTCMPTLLVFTSSVILFVLLVAFGQNPKILGIIVGIAVFALFRLIFRLFWN